MTASPTIELPADVSGPNLRRVLRDALRQDRAFAPTDSRRKLRAQRTVLTALSVFWLATVGAIGFELHRQHGAMPAVAFWLTSWLPILPIFIAYACCVSEWQFHQRKLLSSEAVPLLLEGQVGTATPVILCIEPEALRLESAGASIRWARTMVRSAVETAEHLILIVRSSAIPISKRSLEAHVLQQARAALAGWNCTIHLARRKPASLTIRATLLALAGLGACYGSAKILVVVPPAPSPIELQIQDQTVSLTSGTVLLSDIRYGVQPSEGHPYAYFSGRLRTPRLFGWTLTETYSQGFVPTKQEVAFRDPAVAQAVPTEVTTTALPDDGAVATWGKETTGVIQACVAVRRYLEPLYEVPARVVYRRRVFITACSPTMSPEDLVQWEVAAVPALSGRAQ